MSSLLLNNIQYVILQVHFEKIWQIEFGKITVSKRIKITKIVRKSGLFSIYREVKEMKGILLYNIELSYGLYIQPISSFLAQLI